jgi:hypothetical protein
LEVIQGTQRGEVSDIRETTEGPCSEQQLPPDIFGMVCLREFMPMGKTNKQQQQQQKKKKQEKNRRYGRKRERRQEEGPGARWSEGQGRRKLKKKEN